MRQPIPFVKSNIPYFMNIKPRAQRDYFEKKSYVYGAI